MLRRLNFQQNVLHADFQQNVLHADFQQNVLHADFALGVFPGQLKIFNNIFSPIKGRLTQIYANCVLYTVGVM